MARFQSRRDARMVELPAPVGGWDTESALANMPAKNATRMENYFPDADRVILRRGYSVHSTGIGASVETLMSYAPETGTDELFAIADGSVYDVTSSGAVGAAVASGLSNSRFQYVNFGTAGGQYLIACNGADDPLLYDGTTWSTTAITGVTDSTFIAVQAHQRRLWFAPVDSMTVYYLPVDSVAGAATAFYLGPVARRGGYVMAIGTWTRDSGAGPDDVIVFVTSKGEAIVYQGTDPSSLSTWGIIGVYDVGIPIGRRCIVKAGGDLLLICQGGVVQMSKALTSDTAQQSAYAISSQINKPIIAEISRNGDRFGWQPIIYAAEHMMLLNAPTASATSKQYVFNTLTGAPCLFSGLNAFCWETLGDRIFFGDTSGVNEFNVGSDDNGSVIQGDVIQAYSSFASAGEKHFKRANAILLSSADPYPAVQLYTDYRENTFTAPPIQLGTTESTWGSARWGVSLWGSSDALWEGWVGVTGAGKVAAIHMRTRTQYGRPAWIGTRVTFTVGGHL